MDAENCHQVFPWLWTSGQISPQDIARLPSLQIAAVINLAPPTSSNALAGEAERITRQGIAYVQIPVEWEAPQPLQFEQFVAGVNMFKGSKVWVHYAKNMRVSAFTYLYRKLVLGEQDDTATFPMRAIWEPNPVWQTFIENVCAQYPVGTLKAA